MPRIEIRMSATRIFDVPDGKNPHDFINEKMDVVWEDPTYFIYDMGRSEIDWDGEVIE